MDRYLIKMPREPKEKKKKSPPKKMYQATIESLKGVVVMDDILRFKSKLVLPNQTPAVLIHSLQTLGLKTPGRDVLLETGIGRIVNKLRKHPDPEVGKAATSLYTQWKDIHTHRLSRPQIEVRYDRDTTDTRNRAKKFMSASLQVEESSDLVDCIEREIFHRCNKLLNVHYKRTVRAITFAVKKDTLRTVVVSGELTVEELVTKCKK